MEIILGKYRLEPNDMSPTNWDMYEKITRTKKNDDSEAEKEIYESENNHGYSMSLEYCLQKIAAMEMAKDKRQVDIKTYLNEYIKQKEELRSLLKQVLTINN